VNNKQTSQVCLYGKAICHARFFVGTLEGEGGAMTELDKAFWERRWVAARNGAGNASAEPNRTLTDVAASLPAGAALDAGCGEGLDAVWLASHGWTVTAVDFVDSALQRGRARVEELKVSGQVDWFTADLSTWVPPQRSFDLVSAHYLHGIAQRASLFRRLAAAVRPGGTLLIVGHHPANADLSGGAVPGTVFFTTVDVLEVLDDGWELVTVDDDVPRRVAAHDSRETTLRSAMVQARRVSR
jgi:SAM-dependent methyltransferase